MNILKKLNQMFSPITVIAFVGPSGTGKSFHAKELCEKHNIEAIIDDGLLIQDDKILAGHSAKREKTYMGAVRVALFDEKDHRDSVAKVLRKTHLKKLMIIGTSEKMVMKICTRLQLPQPAQIIKIEDIASKEEIAKAQNSRNVEGKHVIPVASIEVKRNYPQIFTDSIKHFFQKSSRWFLPKSKKNGVMIEKSIVQPEFSKKGRLEISEAALIQIVMEAVKENYPDIVVKKVTVKKDSRGYKLMVIINVPFNTQLTGTIHKLQNSIIDKIENSIGVLIENVSIVIDKIITPEKFGNTSGKSQESPEKAPEKSGFSVKDLFRKKTSKSAAEKTGSEADSTVNPASPTSLTSIESSNSNSSLENGTTEKTNESKKSKLRLLNKIKHKSKN